MASGRRWQQNRLYAICSDLYILGRMKHYPKGGKDGDVWEQACVTVLMLHGAPRPKPTLSPDSESFVYFDENRRKYFERNDWIMEVERTLVDRYKLHPGHIGPFIAAFEKWWTIHREKEVNHV